MQRRRRAYTAPSYVLHGPGRSVFAIPGFRAAEVYETAIANLLPDVRRRPPPETAITVLEWAGHPLATVEAAAVLGVEAEEEGHVDFCALRERAASA